MHLFVFYCKTLVTANFTLTVLCFPSWLIYA